MCISLVLYDSHPELLLLLAFNRDEFWDRPTQPAHFWPDEPCLLAGRDALRKGTWLGVTKHGRFALITNYREPMNAANPTKFVQTTNAPSRGALTTDFLTGTMSPLQYLKSLDLGVYYGFNLLVGDLHSRQVAYVSNRDPWGPRELAPGHYGISNGLLQEWPKVHKCRQALATALELPHLAPEPAAQAQTPAAVGAATPAAASGTEASTAAPTSVSAGTAGGSLAQDNAAAVEPTPPAAAAGAADAAAAVAAAGAAAADDAGLPWPVLFHHVMGDCQLVPPDQEVPLTGVGEHLDRRLSAVFIEPFEMQPGVRYGTRSQTVIAVWRDGRVEQRERYVEKVEGQGDGDDEVMWVWKEQQHEFELAVPGNGSREAADGQQLQGDSSQPELWHIAKGHLQQQQQQQQQQQTQGDVQLHSWQQPQQQ